MKSESVLVLAVMVLLAGLSGPVSAQKYSGGTGEPNSPYRIETAEDLNDIGNHVEDFNKCFVMVADINLAAYAGTQFKIIGSKPNAFTGVFDGNGHTISNFAYSTTSCDDHVGLFGYVGGPDSEIKDLVLIATDVNGGTQPTYDCLVGSLVGELANGSIRNCYAESSSVFGGHTMGGLVSVNRGTITNCGFTGILVEPEMTVGGLVGSNGGTISKCYSIASIGPNLPIFWGAGGLVGSGGGTISNCYSGGSLSAYGQGIGGLVGMGHSSKISNCYSTVNMLGSGGSAGGLVGINCCPEDLEVTASFWDVNSSGIEWSAAGEGKSTVEMQKQSTFTDAGWDFIEIWDIGENQTYPYLRVYPTGDLNHDGRVDFYDFAIAASHWLEGTEP